MSMSESNRHGALLVKSIALAATLVSAIILTAQTGCRNGAREDSPDDTASSLAGVNVPFLVPRELKLVERWQVPVSEWEAATGASCDVREYDAASVFDDAAELTGEPALVVCPLSLVPQLHQESGLAPIPADLSGGWQDVFDGLRKSIGAPGGEPAVFPLSTPPLICFYRSDLLEQAGLSPPATWAEYRHLLSTVEEWAPGYSAVEPWGEQSRTTMFLQRSAGYALHPDNFSFVLNVSTGEPLIDQPPFVRALDEVRTDLVSLDPASLSMSPTECCQQVLQGRAALAICNLPVANDAASDTGSTPQIGVCRLPGAESVFHSQEESWSEIEQSGGNSVTVVGRDAWVVCAVGFPDAESGRHAWELWNAIDSLEDQGTRTTVVLQRGCRPADFLRPVTIQHAGLDATEMEQYIAATTSSLRNSRIVAELPLPRHARFQELMTQRLTEVLEEGREPESALQDLAGDWRQLINELDASSTLNTYRWCLGLSPLPVH